MQTAQVLLRAKLRGVMEEEGQGMSLDISTQIEARLLMKAREQGLSVEALLQRLLSEAPEWKRNGDVPEIPRWNLGAAGSLHRTDLYDDVR